MDRYQGWKWYDNLLILILILAVIYFIFIIGDYFIGALCLALILIIVSSFSKEIDICLADKYKNKNDYNKALNYCNKVLNKTPDYVHAIIEKASIYEDMGKNEEAFKLYESAISEDDTFYIPWVMKGNLYKKLNMDYEAKKAFKKAKILKLKKNEEKITFKLLQRFYFGKKDD
ncbi:MAG: tetratricopeptide repeat protein [Methanobrevibacter sp.]